MRSFYDLQEANGWRYLVLTGRGPVRTPAAGIRQWPAMLYLQSGLHHTIHHRGQLSQYLRPMGAKVPSIYGMSYDDARAAAKK